MKRQNKPLKNRSLHFSVADPLGSGFKQNPMQSVQRFTSIDLSFRSISNFGMVMFFEELTRKFAESSNETAGEHIYNVTFIFSNECHRQKAA